MQTYTINKITYTIGRRGLNENRVGWRSRLIPFTSMLTVEYTPGEQINITLIDKSMVYITIGEERDKYQLKELYAAIC